MNDLPPEDALAEYAAGSLPDADRRRVEAHLANCPRCRTDLAAWTAVAISAGQVAGPTGAVDSGTAPSGPAVVRAVLYHSLFTEPGVPTSGRTRFPLALVLAEARFVRLSMVIASALAMTLGVILAATRPVAAVWAGDVLAMIVPVFTAASIAVVYGPRRDPVFELTAATPTSPRLLLLTRVTLVFGYHLLLALVASAVVTAVGAEPARLDALIVAWLGPMALLSALSLLLAVWLGPDIAVGTAVGLWALRVLAGSPFAGRDGLPRAVLEAWSTNWPGVVLSVVFIGVALILVGRIEPVRRSRATQLM